MKIAIHGKPCKIQELPLLEALLDYLVSCGVEIQLYDKFRECVKKSIHSIENFSIFSDKHSLFDADLFFSIGGDGTLLESVTFIQEKQIPIFGINTGRLGFLANTSVTGLSSIIDDVLNKKFSIEQRTLVQFHQEKDTEPIFGDMNFALNEFAIVKRDTSSMITVHTYLNGSYLNSYWGDGLIIATPTGSTGYSMSCGGPIVMPTSNVLLVTPICPHNLNTRPLIVSDDAVFSFEVEARSKKILLSLDYRSKAVEAKSHFSVKKADFTVQLVSLSKDSFVKSLRSKLHWGLDQRIN